MNWEESRAGTPLKRDFLRAWFERDQRFFLTGGSALGMFYLDHRRSYDLDLFTDKNVVGKEAQNLALQVASEIGAECEAVRTAPDFHRFRITRGEERELVDVVVDRAPQLDSQKETFDGIRVDTLREIIANKLTTLISRTELKDLVDLYFLDQEGHDITAAVSDARKKDGGWDPAVVAMLLEGLDIDECPEWMIKDIAPADLRNFAKDLRLNIAKLALPPAS